MTTSESTAPPQNRSIKYRITLVAGPAEAEVAGYLYPGDPGKPAEPVTPGHVGTSGRLNYGSSLSKGYTRMTMIPVAFGTLCEDADLAGYRPVRITVESQPDGHGTPRSRSWYVPTRHPGDRAAGKA